MADYCHVVVHPYQFMLLLIGLYLAFHNIESISLCGVISEQKYRLTSKVLRPCWLNGTELTALYGYMLIGISSSSLPVSDK